MRAADTIVMLGWPLLAVLLAERVRPHAVAARRVAPSQSGGVPRTAVRNSARHPLAMAGRLILAVGVKTLPAGAATHLRTVAPRRVGLVAVVALLGLAVAPLATPALGVLVWFVGRRQVRRTRQRELDAVTRAIPDLIDLIRLALDSGCTIPLAFTAISGRYRGPLAGALAAVARDVGEGQGTAVALEGLLARVGEPARPLCSALLAGERYGLPTAAMLDALAIEARATRRRHDEQRARRLPITMLFPLITCTLPAFALLTVVPLLASGLQAVRW